VVRKEAVQLLGAAAHARPALAGPCLPASLPLLLKLTAVDKSLVRIVDLGPFKQTVDDGLSMRKHTFECLEVSPSIACKSGELAAQHVSAHQAR
jgi:cullin-associated NEDD8-dissociated protein 1